jgi:mitofilin
MTQAGDPVPLLPPPRRRRFMPRFLLYSTLSLTLFYGVSTLLALNSDRYADFFAESVPLGDRILDQVEGTDFAEKAKQPVIRSAINASYGLGSLAQSGANAAGRAWNTAKDKIEDVSDSGAKAADTTLRDGRAQLAEARGKAKDMNYKIQKKADAVAQHAKDGAASASQSVQNALSSAGESAKELGEEAKAKLQELVGRGKEAAGEAEQQARRAGAKVEEQGRGLLNRGKAALEEAKPAPYGQPLPLQHEAPAGFATPRTDRGLSAEKHPNARLRENPEAPKLPKLAPALSSLSGSEPMVSQLAGTIDELAAFLRDTPNSGFQARGVLDDAKADLEQLAARLETIKRNEAARVEKGLADAASKYDKQLAAAREEAGKQVGEVDAAWKKRDAEERKKQRQEYENQLRAELATQSEIINERLREEVVAQGIEMQRRWMRDIKKRVEEERGGRLARLDELASDLKHLEEVTMENSSQLDEGSNVHTLWAAVRAAKTAVLSDEERADAESGAPRKRAFRDELNVLRASPRAKDDELIRTAVGILERNPAVDSGLASFTELHRWFADRVAPACQRAALVPDHAGILSHIGSAVVSPIFYARRGYVAGEDTPSTLARAHYWLERQELDAAAREVNSLKGWPKILAEDWLDAARARLEAQQALEVSSARRVSAPALRSHISASARQCADDVRGAAGRMSPASHSLPLCCAKSSWQPSSCIGTACTPLHSVLACFRFQPLRRSMRHSYTDRPPWAECVSLRRNGRPRLGRDEKLGCGWMPSQRALSGAEPAAGHSRVSVLTNSAVLPTRSTHWSRRSCSALSCVRSRTRGCTHVMRASCACWSSVPLMSFRLREWIDGQRLHASHSTASARTSAPS